MVVRILSGGAANGLVSALSCDFETRSGHCIEGDFGAVGAMRERVEAGEPVDLIILTRAIIDELARENRVSADSVADLGTVVTGVAVQEGTEVVDVSTPDALAVAFEMATSLYVPDTERATAGIHVAAVIRKLGLEKAMAPKLRKFRNGQTAMAAMAAEGQRGALGCTQVTEILNTPGVNYCGELPGDLGLATTYTAAVSSEASEPDAARAFVTMLTAPEAMTIRRKAGFS